MLTTSQALAEFLRSTVEREEKELSLVTSSQSLERPKDGSWSRREELGHLIDSAVNNHIRFVRGSVEGAYEGPGYAQEDWVRAHGYHEISWPDLITMWQQHNLALLHVVRRIPDAKLTTPCRISGSDPVTLAFVIEDYVWHMQHHLDHIMRREKITEYPGAKMPI